MSSLELLLFSTAGLLLARRPGVRWSECVSLGIVGALLALSGAFQLAFLLGAPALSFGIEAAAALASLRLIWRRRAELFELGRACASFAQRHRLLCALLAASWLYLGLQALLIPPSDGDSLTYHLARVLLFQQERSLFPEQINKLHVAVFPVGADLLSHLFLRFYSDLGVALPGFLSYVAIALGSYALARRCAAPPAALTAALVVLGLPELVLQATSTKNNLPAAAAALFCLLLAGRLLERPRFSDLAGLALGLAFGISARTTFLAFAAPFALVFGGLLLRRHGVGPWRALAVRHWRGAALCALPLLVFSQLWLFAHNAVAWGGWAGPPDFVAFHRNLDGPRGALANLARYAIQSVDLTRPVDLLVGQLAGSAPSDWLQAAYAAWVEPWADVAGLNRNYVFAVEWAPHEARSGFGPLGFALVLPSLVACVVRARGFPRALAWTLLGYLALVSAALAWFPFNQRMLTPAFAASAPCVAHCLERWRLRPASLAGLRLVALACLLYAGAFNAEKPLLRELDPLRWPRLVLRPARVLADNVWSRCAFGADRLCQVRLASGEALEPASLAVPPGARVALLVDGTTPIYHLLLRNPGARFSLRRPGVEPGLDLEALLAARDGRYDLVLCLARSWPPCGADAELPAAAGEP